MHGQQEPWKNMVSLPASQGCIAPSTYPSLGSGPLFLIVGRRGCVFGSIWGLGALYPRCFLVRLSRMGVDGEVNKGPVGERHSPSPLRAWEQVELCRVLNNGAEAIGSHPRNGVGACVAQGWEL